MPVRTMNATDHLPGGVEAWDAGLAILGKLTNLRKLLLDGTRITNEGLAHLQKLHGKELDSEERDIVRASYLRSRVSR